MYVRRGRNAKRRRVRVPPNVVMVAHGGERAKNICKQTRYALHAWRRENTHRQRSWTTSFRIEETHACFGTLIIGNHSAHHATAEKQDKDCSTAGAHCGL
ncbi:MAG: hypothetical protein KatS3mg038_3407 [Candidatus Kapaibacterium sp.]|nr:MAG: hypothetical protein KatS3mg038_0464 [Candidatus Kapabacteria bacterium]GIV51707.1 MAG: hypothetical protein KatS3mg038_2228 [Candidatus Kapabacteria bacterium]GIV52886.1 MAG: hypothetical protein KatS3mg038_3407 [Candidatus Kapabacteria bacterium]